MILLRPDCLVFKRKDGENVPCSTEEIVVELLGDSAKAMDENFLHNVSQAVLQYFKHDLGWTTVTLGEFSVALSKVLRSFGMECKVVGGQDVGSRVAEADLGNLAAEGEGGFELFFFNRLREELRCKLGDGPRVVRFRGLRQCVKRLTGAKRWTPRCQDLNDRIVDYLRTCLTTEARGTGCALVVV